MISFHFLRCASVSNSNVMYASHKPPCSLYKTPVQFLNEDQQFKYCKESPDLIMLDLICTAEESTSILRAPFQLCSLLVLHILQEDFGFTCSKRSRFGKTLQFIVWNKLEHQNTKFWVTKKNTFGVFLFEFELPSFQLYDSLIVEHYPGSRHAVPYVS